MFDSAGPRKHAGLWFAVDPVTLIRRMDSEITAYRFVDRGEEHSFSETCKQAEDNVSDPERGACCKRSPTEKAIRRLWPA
jgi:hypothetical protein